MGEREGDEGERGREREEEREGEKEREKERGREGGRERQRQMEREKERGREGFRNFLPSLLVTMIDKYDIIGKLVTSSFQNNTFLYTKL